MPSAKSRLTEPVEMEGTTLIGLLRPETHDRALTELLLDLADGHFDGLHTLTVVAVFNWRHNAPCQGSRFGGHCTPPRSLARGPVSRGAPSPHFGVRASHVDYFPAEQ